MRINIFQCEDHRRDKFGLFGFKIREQLNGEWVTTYKSRYEFRSHEDAMLAAKELTKEVRK